MSAVRSGSAVSRRWRVFDKTLCVCVCVCVRVNLSRPLPVPTNDSNSCEYFRNVYKQTTAIHVFFLL